MAAERTLMAWIRTSLSMIGFGFTIQKFFQYMRESLLIETKIPRNEPLNIGLILVVTGLLFLIIASLEHVQFLRRLDIERHHRLPLSLPLAAALLLLMIGLLALIDIVFRWTG